MIDRPASRRLAVAAALDVASIVLFVALGREEHDDGTAPTPFFEVLAPFLVGLVVAWAAARAWRQPFSWQTGTGVWAITVLAGMVLRKSLFGDGTAVAFVIVASAFLGVTLVGWRLLAAKFTGDVVESPPAAG